MYLYLDANNRKYFQYSNKTIICKLLMLQYKADLFFKASSFRSFYASINYLYGDGTYNRNLLDAYVLQTYFLHLS